MLRILGLVLVVFSLPGLLRPAEVVRNAKRVDAADARASTGVEPSDGQVTTTRIVAGAMLVVGLAAILW